MALEHLKMLRAVHEKSPRFSDVTSSCSRHMLDCILTCMDSDMQHTYSIHSCSADGVHINSRHKFPRVGIGKACQHTTPTLQSVKRWATLHGQTTEMVRDHLADFSFRVLQY